MGLAAEIGERLTARGWTVSVAESCTGGLLGGVLTAVSGSSAYFRGGIIAYSNEAKRRLLGVPTGVLARHGAVSAPVARAMAGQVRRRFETDFGIGITGVAGPGGGTPRKPVGRVWIAVAGPRRTAVRGFRFPGGRRAVRLRSCRAALGMLRAALTRR